MIDKMGNTIVNDKVKSVYSFNDYSIQDLLSKFFEQINSVTDLVNQNEEKINTQNFKLEEFINYMKSEGIPPIVIETVTTMYNDGRLTELFNSLANNVIDKVEDFKTQINSSLEQKVKKYDDNIANIEYFRFLAINIGQPTEDWIPAIKQCFLLFNNAYIPHDIKISEPILLKSYQKLKGFSRETKIKPNINFEGDCLVGIATKNEIKFQIETIGLHGDRYNHIKSFKGLYINNENQGRDSHIKINDVFIEEVPGDGFYLTGRGENFISNIVTRDNKGNGYYINVVDSWFSNLSSGINVGSKDSETGYGFFVSGANNRFMNCKAWFSDIGFYLSGTCSKSLFANCEAQDNIIGLRVRGKDNSFYGSVEGVGIDTINYQFPYGYVENMCAIEFLSESQNNIININASDRKQFITAGTFDYFVDINGTNNKLYGGFSQLKKGIIKDKTKLYSNILDISGMSNTNEVWYFKYDKQKNITENNLNEIYNNLKSPTVYDGNCSITKGNYTIKNGICYINFELKALKDYGYANILLNNLPRPLCDAPVTIYNEEKKCIVNVNGELSVGSSITTNDIYKISGSYIIKNT